MKGNDETGQLTYLTGGDGDVVLAKKMMKIGKASDSDIVVSGILTGKNAATMLGLDNQIGTITPGAMADLILVGGDPLNNFDDLLRIVAVVRNGRFFSLVSLLERVTPVTSVE